MSVESHTLCWFLGFRFPLCHASANRGMKPSRNHGGPIPFPIDERPWEDVHVSYHNT